MNRSTFAALAIAVAGLFAPLTSAQADEAAVAAFYRGKTIKLLVGASAGGGYDLVGRTVAKQLGSHIPGHPSITVENMPAASGLVMGNFLFNTAARDGTVMGLPTNAFPLEPRLHLLTRAGGSLNFDIDRFTWIGNAARQPQVLFMWHKSAVKSIEDLKKTPSLIGAISVGADSYTLPSTLNAILPAKMKVIPGYAGIGETLLAMERGELDGHSAGLANIISAKPDWIKEGKLRVLAQFGLTRQAELPDVPTGDEIVADPLDKEMLRFFALKYELAYAFILPPEVPQERVTALKAAFDATMKDPAYQAMAEQLALPRSSMTSDEVQSVIERIKSTPETVVARMRGILDNVQKK
jgi:tripartite-type tricarboxylate transporter receptor subunit TctC